MWPEVYARNPSQVARRVRRQRDDSGSDYNFIVAAPAHEALGLRSSAPRLERRCACAGHFDSLRRERVIAESAI